MFAMGNAYQCDQCQRVGRPEQEIGWREVQPLGLQRIGADLLPPRLIFCGAACEIAYMQGASQGAPTQRLDNREAPHGC